MLNLGVNYMPAKASPAIKAKPFEAFDQGSEVVQSSVGG